MIKNDQIEKKIISFSEAFQFLKKFRYKPRSQWTKEEKNFSKYAILLFCLKKGSIKCLLPLTASAN